jgi:hypothetical protein
MMAEKANEYHFANRDRTSKIRAQNLEQAKAYFMEKYGFEPELIKEITDLKY